MSAFLPRSEVERLTKRVKFSAQRRALARMGIRFVPAADGEPLVRADALDGKPAPARNSSPRWERIGEKSPS